MRQTLFRGKRIDNHEWIEGYLTQNEFGQFVIQAFQKKGYLFSTPVNPTSIGQFTELLDQNGEKIFEGDVITSTFPKDEEFDAVDYVCDFVIEYSEGCFWAKELKEPGSDGAIAPAYAHLDESDNISVLKGNIHEELLEK